MGAYLSLRVDGIDTVKAVLDKIDPKKNSAWIRSALIDCAELVQKIAAEEKIIRGSRFRGPKGPRGGKGKLFNAPVNPDKLTSRHGGAGLVGSIKVDRHPLPFSIDIGSDKKYAPVHELGWSGTQHVREHTRTVAFGRKVSPFKVHSFSRQMHFKARPFLAPGLEDASKNFGAIFVAKLEKELP